MCICFVAHGRKNSSLRPCLLGRKFFIQIDQHGLKYFMEQRVVTPEQYKRVTKLLRYDYEIIYWPGKENSATDAVSRKPDNSILHHLHKCTRGILIG